MGERLFDVKVKALQSDNGGEFVVLSPHCAMLGITMRFSCPHTHPQNGLVERKIQHITEVGLSLLAKSGISLSYWWFAFSTAVHIINLLPTAVLHHTTPFSKLYNKRPNYSHLKVFGCACFPFLRPYNNSKLQFRSSKCIFLGYNSNHKGYLCLHPSGRLYVSATVDFNEHDFPFSSLMTPEAVVPQSAPITTAIIPSFPSLPHTPSNSSSSSFAPPVFPDTYSPLHPSDTSSSSSSNTSPQPTTAPPPQNTHPMVTRAKSGIQKPRIFLSSVPVAEPVNVSEALQVPEWKAAMESEYAALIKNDTWKLVPYEAHMNMISTKWLFRVKYNKDGSVERYKAQLVARGFQQHAGVDYFHIFSPVIKPMTLRVVFSLAVTRGWKIQQVDINNAFLNGSLKETVYIDQPEGFHSASQPHHVCKLVKALYGLKLAPKAWYDTLKGFLISSGFTHSLADHCLFHKAVNGKLLVLLVYVDDILITGDDPLMVQQLITALNSSFSLKHLGENNYFLGLEAHVTNQCISLTQSKYARELIAKAHLQNCKPSPTPLCPSHKLSCNDSSSFDNPSLYRSIIGGLQYLTLTRPDLSFSVNKLSQFLQEPTQNHWKACKRVLRYIRGTISNGLKFVPVCDFRLHGFADADYASSVDDRRSTSGLCVYLGPNLITWCSKKQQVVARSSTEVEYRSMALITTDLLWLHTLFSELHLPLLPPSIIWCDNQGAIKLSFSPAFHSRTKHIEVDVHFLREKVQSQVLDFRYISSDDQVADIFTKPLSPTRFLSLSSKLGMLQT